ncbi:MAG: PhoH family protein [candidate division WOR-3 bacterium]|nr:MAG: PhoH family protein [candidate division WOR-3 bacterium]
MRDDYIHLKGSEKNVKAAEKVVRSRLGTGDVRFDVDDDQEPKRTHEQSSSVSTPKRLIRSKSSGQADYLKAIDHHDIVVSIGPAGTGKTYLAVAKAVSYLIERKVERLVLTRPAVEAGESLGFLPGAIEEKVDPYLRPLYDALNDFLPYDRIRRYLDMKTIEVAPLAYMRGRTLNDSFIILDEAQNTTGMQMKMFLTRMGWRSKVVVTGDITQVDLPPNVFSGLIEIQHLLKKISGIEFIYLSEKDVVRHRLVQKIIKAYEAKNTT